MIEVEKVAVATKLYILSPCRDTEGYGANNMMIFAGIDTEFAVTKPYETAFCNELKVLEQKMTKSVRQTDQKLQLTQFKIVNKFLPSTDIPTVLQIIGCRENEIFR